MSKSQVKKLLTSMSKEDIINVVLELYDARKEAREYLDYFVNPNDVGELEKFKKIVFKEFDDDISRDPQCRFSVCRKALSGFKKLAPSTNTLAEAMVYYVERVCEFSFYAGDLWEQYYDSAVSNFRSMLKFLVKNNMLEAMMPRVVQIMAWCWPCGYGFPTRLVIRFTNLFLQNITARLMKQMLWAKHNTIPYIQNSDIDRGLCGFIFVYYFTLSV